MLQKYFSGSHSESSCRPCRSHSKAVSKLSYVTGIFRYLPSYSYSPHLWFFICLFILFRFFLSFFNKQKTKGGHVAVISVWDFCLFILCSSSRHLMVYRACLHCLQWERERACSGTLLELSNCKAQSRPNRQSASQTARDWSGKKPNTNGLV